MPDTSPLRPGDPGRIGAYRLLGRLGDGGQGVVYLGENPSGEQFAIKWLRAELAADPVGRERFLREVAAAQRVAAFCTAQIVETGVEQDRPYIVSEYIAGPSLQTLVSTSGPRTGPSLHRLAVGTATALTAIHQAGIVHRDFKPANVLMAPDGPRVIDFGIAKALDNAAVTLTSRPVGTPSYMSPEQLSGQPAGAPADMFAWACTMVYAATGEPPFGRDMVAAVIHRILTTTPDLDRLHGTLREVVAACLDKDPANRPTAEQVLLRLLQQNAPGPAAAAPQHAPGPAVLQQAAAVAAQPVGEPVAGPAAPAPPEEAPTQRATRPPAAPWPPQPPVGHPAPPPPGPVSTAPRGPYHVGEAGTIAGSQRSPGRKLAIAGSAAALALLLALAGILFALNGRGGTDTTTVAAGDTATTTASTPTPTPTPTPEVPTEGLTETKLPGAEATAYEHPDDKISLAYYYLERKGKNQGDLLYPRTSRTGSFRRTEKYWSLSVSPDRSLEVGRTKKYTDDYHAVELVDRQTGRIRSINTVKKPLTYEWPAWSKDSKRLLLTIRDPRPEEWKTLGFIIVDTVAGTAKINHIADNSIVKGRFYWAGDESQVATHFAAGKGFGLRFYDLDGKVTREITGIGEPYTTSPGPFSPSGRQFATRCPDGEPGDCVWDTTTGERIATVNSSCYKILGWYDEKHLFCWADSEGGGDQVNVVNLRGEAVRVMLKIGEDEPPIGPQYVQEEHG
jgi:Serine/threonine protein kinase